MKRINLIIFGILTMSLFLTQSCTEDDGLGGGGGAGDGAPFVELLPGDDLVDFSATIEPGASFTVRLDATPDASLLANLEIFRDGFSEDAANISIDGLSVANNPQVIVGDDQNGITWDITILGPTTDGVYTYDFDVTDAGGETSSTGITITVEAGGGGGGGGGTIAPTVGLIGTDIRTANAGELVAIDIDAQIGDSDLSEITVLEDGFTMTDLDRLFYKEVSRNFETNPQPVDAEDAAGAFFTVFIRATEGDHDYTIELRDVSDLTASVDFRIEESMPSTPLDAEFTAVLVSNASGPSLGGLDLDDGVAVSSSSSMAEIVDQGIDVGQPTASNWIQRIAPANGSLLRFVDLSTTELGSFANVLSKEDILTAWDSGTDITTESDVVLVGDTFVSNLGNNFYIFTVTEVNVTAADNEDFYVFDIKR